jgi:hypothetical protein
MRRRSSGNQYYTPIGTPYNRRFSNTSNESLYYTPTESFTNLHTVSSHHDNFSADDLMNLAEGGYYKPKRSTSNLADIIQRSKGNPMKPANFLIASNESLSSFDSLHSLSGSTISLSQDPYNIDKHIGYINPKSKSFQTERLKHLQDFENPKPKIVRTDTVKYLDRAQNKPYSRSLFAKTNQLQAWDRASKYFPASTSEREILKKQFLAENYALRNPGITKIKNAAIKVGNTIKNTTTTIGNTVSKTTAAAVQKATASVAKATDSFIAEASTIVKSANVVESISKYAQYFNYATVTGLQLAIETVLAFISLIQWNIALEHEPIFEQYEKIELKQTDKYFEYYYGQPKNTANINYNLPYTKPDEVKQYFVNAIPNVTKINDLVAASSNNSNVYHYAILSQQEYNDLKATTYKGYELIKQNYSYSNGGHTITTKQNIYFLGGQAYEDKYKNTADGILRYIMIPILGPNGVGKVWFRFVRRPDQYNQTWKYSVGYNSPGLNSGKNNDLEYNQWIQDPESIKKYSYFAYWKENYSTISPKDMYDALSNNATADQLEKMKTGGISFQDAKQQIDSTTYPPQTHDVVMNFIQFFQFHLDNIANDELSVIEFIKTQGMKYGGWSLDNYKIIWDFYNVWRQKRGLPALPNTLIPSVDESSNVNEDNMISGNRVEPGDELFAPLYKAQHQRFKKQFKWK